MRQTNHASSTFFCRRFDREVKPYRQGMADYRWRAGREARASRAACSKNAVELRGFEPLTFCMPYRPRLSLDAAWRRHASRSPAPILAPCGLTLPGACRRWLPTWLPGNSLAALTSGRRNRAAGRPETGGDDLPRHLRGAPGPAPAGSTSPGTPRTRHPLTLYLGTSSL
jgi:hypothetical protein